MYIPQDFKEHGFDSIVSLSVRYNTHYPYIYRWKKATGTLLKRGRPKLDIDIAKLEKLKNEGYTLEKLSIYFNCSIRTIKNRVREINLQTLTKIN